MSIKLRRENLSCRIFFYKAQLPAFSFFVRYIFNRKHLEHDMTDKPNPPHPISRLYARYLTAEEKRALRLVPIAGVSSEINLLRVLSAHFLKFQQSAPSDLSSHMQALRTYTLLCEQLAILVRSHEREHGPQSEMDDLLYEALSGMAQFAPDAEERSLNA